MFVASTASGVGGELVLEFLDASFVGLTSEVVSIDFPTSGFQQLSLELIALAGTTSYRFLLQISGAANAGAVFDDALLTGVAAPPPTETPTPTPPESPTPTPPGGGGDDDDAEDPELAASLYLRNPTFEIEEDGLARHWRSEGGQVFHTTELVRTGKAAGHAVGNLSTAITVSQTVRLLSENTRRFAVYALGSPPGGTVQLAIQWLLLADQPIADPIATAPMTLDGAGYQEIALVATPPPRAAGAILTITVVNGSLGDNVRLDDASWRTSRAVTTQPSPGEQGTTPQESADGPSTTSRPDDLAALARSASEVVITEVLYAPEGGGAEWIELRNVGDTPVLLSNWVLFDNFGQVALGSTVLTPGGYHLVASEGALPAGVDSAYFSPTGSLGNGLANDGDHLLLIDHEGALVDSLSWGDDPTVFAGGQVTASTGRSVSRLAGEVDTDAPSDFQSAHPTPLRGLASFDREGPVAPQTSEGDDDGDQSEDDEAALDNPGDDGSAGLNAWLLVLVLVAIVLATGGAAAWFRREELTDDLARLRPPWWK